MTLDQLPPRVRDTLARLHAASDQDLPRIALGLARSLGMGLTPHHMRDAYISVDRAQGAWLYGQVLEQGARNVVEFGASFGISAIWMGAAVGQTGGRVVTTEIEPAKIQAATVNIAEAGLDGTVRLLGGDAVERLRDHPGPVDLLFFDGWVDRYMPLLDLLEDRLAEGCLLIIDNANFPPTRAFLTALAARPGWEAEAPWGTRVARARWRPGRA